MIHVSILIGQLSRGRTAFIISTALLASCQQMSHPADCTYEISSSQSRSRGACCLEKLRSGGITLHQARHGGPAAGHDSTLLQEPQRKFRVLHCCYTTQSLPSRLVPLAPVLDLVVTRPFAHLTYFRFALIHLIIRLVAHSPVNLDGMLLLLSICFCFCSGPRHIEHMSLVPFSSSMAAHRRSQGVRLSAFLLVLLHRTKHCVGCQQDGSQHR